MSYAGSGSTDISRSSSTLNISFASGEESYSLGRQSFSRAFSQVSLTNALRSLYEKYTVDRSSPILPGSDKKGTFFQKNLFSFSPRPMYRVYFSFRKGVESVGVSDDCSSLQNCNSLFPDHVFLAALPFSRTPSQETLTGATKMLSNVELDREVGDMFDKFVRINNAVQVGKR